MLKKTREIHKVTKTRLKKKNSNKIYWDKEEFTAY